MATVATPIICYVTTALSSIALNQSSNATVTCDFRTCIEAGVPFTFGCTTVSADPTVDVYRSVDGTAGGFDSIPFDSFSIARTANANVKMSRTYPHGLYAFKFTSSGPNTQTFAILTQEVVTGILQT